MAVASHAFARCTVCTHASMYRPGEACRLCQGGVKEETAPTDLWKGWRCSCFHCVMTMC
ncbi:MAG TPA: hypothetical protein VI997_00680 [Candidatus Thermoplasmatota archaeon]|nr:hypothetical protein [Candidatus Thermoplasmatota archaeon]